MAHLHDRVNRSCTVSYLGTCSAAMHTSKSRRLLTVLFTAASGICFIAQGGCFNFTGANKAKAEQEAKSYEAQARAAGANVTFVGCTDHDSDSDGYLACDFLFDGQPVTLDCAGKNLLQDNHGCKAYVAKTKVIDGRH